MPMIPFATRFPDLALRETRSVEVRGRPDLPDGDYGFIELYCNEDPCDCRRVIIQVVSRATGDKVLATIGYGWEPVAFYKKSLHGDRELAKDCKGPSLDPINAQSQFAPALLKLFRIVLQGAEYAQRLERHYRLFKSPLTTVEAILDELGKSTGYFPEDAVELAIARKDEVTPGLLDILDRCRKNPEAFQKDGSGLAHLYAMYLLAQFRETRAFPILVDILRLPKGTVDDLLGDTITEGLARILASLCGGDIDPIKRLIEDPTVDEWVRGAALYSISELYFQNLLDRQPVVEYFRHLLTGGLEQEYNNTWDVLASCMYDMHPGELLDEIRPAYESGYVDPGYVGLDEMESAARKSVDAVMDRSREEKYSAGLIDNVSEEMKWWACFKRTPRSDHRSSIAPEKDKDAGTPQLADSAPAVQAAPAISRCKPCPCGSGRKYKKCCGKEPQPAGIKPDGDTTGSS